MALMYLEQLTDLDVEEMQYTHEEEVKILNDIEKLSNQYLKDKSKLPELEAKLDEYITHVKEHFSKEQELMEEYDFPSMDMHEMAHDMFIADMNYSQLQWKKHGNLEKIINFIRKVPEWLVMHINTVDAPTATYIAQKMAKAD